MKELSNLIRSCSESESQRLGRERDRLERFKSAGVGTWDDAVRLHKIRRRLVEIEIDGVEAP